MQLTDWQLGQIILFLTTVGGFIITAWREHNARLAREKKEERDRQWQIEDRQREMDEIVEKAKAEAEALRIKGEVIAAKIAKSAAESREDQRIATDTLEHHILEAKEAAASAYKEANHINLKIEDLNERLIKQGKAVKDDNKKLDNIQTSADNIQTSVDEIHKKM